MYELIQISEHDYYINCPAKIGVIQIAEDTVVLIDSGNDKDAGKKVLRILEAKGWKLAAIYNTHSHADHIGGNRYLQDKTGCEIYTYGIETAYTNTPVLEPVGLYGGLPMKELKNKFLMAQPSRAKMLRPEDLPKGMELLLLPGHCADMVGFKTSDGTAYIGDCVSSEETLAKYGIGYMWDPETARTTLEYVKRIDALNYVPAHAPVSDHIAELADINIQSIENIKSQIVDMIKDGVTFEKLLQQIFEKYNMRMNIQQYALIGSTLRAYLTNLYEQGTASYEFENNQMIWKSVQK